MLKALKREEVPVYHLPGRDWFLCIGPENTDAKNATLGVAVFQIGMKEVHNAQGVETRGSARLSLAGTRLVPLHWTREHRREECNAGCGCLSRRVSSSWPRPPRRRGAQISDS